MNTPEIHPATLEIEHLRDACELRFQRRSGPGGQHRNKVETSVHVTHLPTGVRAAASERRNQAENLKVAMHRLRVQLALEVRCPWQRPSELWKTRCGGGKVHVSDQHEDFAAMLSEALDALASHNGDYRSTAAALAISPTQYLKLLQREAKAFLQLNEQRSTNGLSRLKPVR